MQAVSAPAMATASHGDGNAGRWAEPKLCLQCATGSLSASTIDGSDTAAWVRKMGLEDPVPTRFGTPGVAHPTKRSPAADIEIRFTIDEDRAGDLLMWWAAMPLPLMLAAEPQHAADAYDVAHGIPNAGIVRVGAGGKVSIKLMTPQPYREEGAQWPRHAHFVLPRTDGADAWDHGRVYTVAAWPGVRGAVEVKDLGTPRALGMYQSRGYVSPRVVRGCWNLPIVLVRACAGDDCPLLSKSGEPMNPATNLALNYDAEDEDVMALASYLRELGLPAVLYCASSSCPAAAILTRRILATGLFSNLFYMKDGVRGWLEEIRNQ